MPPKKKLKQTAAPGDNSRKEANNVEPQRRSSRSTRGTGGHVAQLEKTGEKVAAPTKQRKAPNDFEISDSEENPMAPSQFERLRKKVTTFLL